MHLSIKVTETPLQVSFLISLFSICVSYFNFRSSLILFCSVIYLVFVLLFLHHHVLFIQFLLISLLPHFYQHYLLSSFVVYSFHIFILLLLLNLHQYPHSPPSRAPRPSFSSVLFYISIFLLFCLVFFKYLLTDHIPPYTPSSIPHLPGTLSYTLLPFLLSPPFFHFRPL